MSQETLTVTLAGREYLVACETGEKELLLACARHVDQKMLSIQASNKVLGADRMAALAALQIAQELYTAKKANPGPSADTLRDRLQDLNRMADEILAPQEKLFP